MHNSPPLRPAGFRNLRLPRALAALLACLVALTLSERAASAQSLEEQLLAESPASLADQARQQGDARRGAIVFHQPNLACSKCHQPDAAGTLLGPELDKLGAEVTDAQLVDAVLRPSQSIRKGFETVSIVTVDGRVLRGLLATSNDFHVVLRDAARNFQTVTIPRGDIDEQQSSDVSLMPAGQVNTLAGRQQFLDLLRYLMEIRDGGPERAGELKPPPSLYAARPLPEYENNLDHAGLIRDLGVESFRRGEAIYNRLCVNCHGTHDRPGSLPTSLPFASGKFKNGSDPFSMYQTLTRGFGMMVPQTWMVPKQKYDVIHYIREAYLRQDNPSQYVEVHDEYLAGLPSGSSRGPEPSNIQPWEQMDYGSNLVGTYEIGDDGGNFAYKGNAIRLDPGPGGVSRGRHWMIFDFDTLRGAAAWSGRGFIDWNGINFNGRHGVHPRVVGQVQWANPTGPGWANPETGRFDDPRLRGRDGRPYGPLPRDWAHYRGMYHHGQRTLIAYTVGRTEVLELPGLEWVEPSPGRQPPSARATTGGEAASTSEPANSERANSEPASSEPASSEPASRQAAAGGEQSAASATLPVFQRTFRFGSRERELTLQVAHLEGARLVSQDSLSAGESRRVIAFAPPDSPLRPASEDSLRFDGATRLEIAEPADFEMRDKDFSITARIKTRGGGTIFAQTADQPRWVPDGKTFFVRGGRLAFDIGWVGVVTSRRKVNDGQWHDVAAVYTAADGQLRLYIDGKRDAQGSLKPKSATPDHVVRIGYTSENFPGEQSYFEGELGHVRFYQRALSSESLERAVRRREDDRLVGDWNLNRVRDDRVEDRSGGGHHGRVVRAEEASSSRPEGKLVAGLSSNAAGLRWLDDGNGNLRLRIPAGDEPLRFTLWTARVSPSEEPRRIASLLALEDSHRDLIEMTRGGPPRWPEVLTTRAVPGDGDGPYVVDVLTRPVSNPWFCRLRLTGFDFYPDGDRAAVCAWDGSVWLVSGLAQLPAAGQPKAAVKQEAAGKQDTLGKEEALGSKEGAELRWRRIASGLFQPLGLKIVDGRIFVTCRDQICILHDLNDDGETDFYQNFNNDHQVTEHFHEFAMGLQVDEQGNFYYAKSARHALPALVPHHGTLLRVSKDGRRTEILATGFRAANGVCLNPDGTFIVTDQEGHWNPKNRINWVEPGGFYGNMYGYHDVTDSSDEAMQQPLCWITNAFDRSPAELLWADSTRWGPLHGSLLNLSYGYGKIYVVPFEDMDGQKQGGMCELPLPQFPTGIMRGRFSPGDGQLYACGMFAWAGTQQQPGGFYRVRYTGREVHLPVGLHARPGKLEIVFSGPLDADSASDISNFQVKVWSLQRTANYGSPHINERPLEVRSAELSDDQRTLTLHIPEMEPTWCMEVRYRLRSLSGKPVDGTLHNTIHQLGD